MRLFLWYNLKKIVKKDFLKIISKQSHRFNKIYKGGGQMNYCPNCGNELEKDSKFCTNCGEKIPSFTSGSGQSNEGESEEKINQKSEPEKAIGNKKVLGIVALAAVVVIGLFLIRPLLFEENDGDSTNEMETAAEDLQDQDETGEQEDAIIEENGSEEELSQGNEDIVGSYIATLEYGSDPPPGSKHNQTIIDIAKNESGQYEMFFGIPNYDIFPIEITESGDYGYEGEFVSEWEETRIDIAFTEGQQTAFVGDLNHTDYGTEISVSAYMEAFPLEEATKEKMIGSYTIYVDGYNIIEEDRNGEVSEEISEEMRNIMAKYEQEQLTMTISEGEEVTVKSGLSGTSSNYEYHYEEGWLKPEYIDGSHENISAKVLELYPFASKDRVIFRGGFFETLSSSQRMKVFITVVKDHG
ncbi:MAG TPA: hypothetical protein DHN33_09720 [Eubacteriaceae bacterium]|nr:hypothetical protein [Eubacteriaceae bacterium]